MNVQFVSGATLAASQTCGEDLIGPAPAAHSPQSRLVDGITLNQFELNLEQGTECFSSLSRSAPLRFPSALTPLQYTR